MGTTNIIHELIEFFSIFYLSYCYLSCRIRKVGNAFLHKNSNFIMIEGKIVNLRALEVDDLEIHKKWRNNKINRRHTREYRLLNMINQKEWFEFVSKDNPPKNIMFGVTNKQKKLIGVCGLTYIDWKNRHCEISIILYKTKWQSTKEAKEVISILLDYGFGELNMHRLWVEIFDTYQKI